MNWKTIYAERLTGADEAVALIRPGNRVVVGHAAGEPTCLVDAMARNRHAYRDVEVTHLLPMGNSPCAQAGMEPHFRHNSLFLGASTRETVRAGHGEFTPCYLSRVSSLFETTLPPDVALIQVSPPDQHGYCSCGISVDYTKAAAERAKLVIAQVNPRMPRTLGDTFLHVARLDRIVECDAPLIELPPPAVGEAEKAIGRHCAGLIRDGDCLQLGIGAIPDSILTFLENKNDLGIHSEMFSDGVVRLMEAGVITNGAKNFHPGVAVATFLMGTRKLYDYVDDNPAINLYPASYVNDPLTAGKNDRLVAINSCIQVDLLGQVCSEAIGPTQISGVGGQVDFVRAAAISRGGRAVIAMPSTAAGGTISRIVPRLDEWAVVTTNRYDVEYIVTEYGIANLRGRTVKDRARMLIGIAHPDFRDALKEAFEKRFNAKY